MNNKYYKSISEISELLHLNQHVIRYWDSKFEGVSTRLNNKKRRYFNPQNIRKLEDLKKLLHTNGKSHYSLEMAKNILGDGSLKKNLKLAASKTLKPAEVEELISISDKLKKLIK